MQDRWKEQKRNSTLFLALPFWAHASTDFLFPLLTLFPFLKAGTETRAALVSVVSP